MSVTDDLDARVRALRAQGDTVGISKLFIEVGAQTLDYLLDTSPVDDETTLAVGLALLDALVQEHDADRRVETLEPRRVWLVTGPPAAPELTVGYCVATLDPGFVTKTTKDHPSMPPRVYESPEQRAGEPLEVQHELYLVGCVLHELRTGQRGRYGVERGGAGGGALGYAIDCALAEAISSRCWGVEAMRHQLLEALKPPLGPVVMPHYGGAPNLVGGATPSPSIGDAPGLGGRMLRWLRQRLRGR